MFDYEKITEALKVIKETCKKAECCDKCPLGDYDDICILQYTTPMDLQIADYNIPQVIKLLR